MQNRLSKKIVSGISGISIKITFDLKPKVCYTYTALYEVKENFKTRKVRS